MHMKEIWMGLTLTTLVGCSGATQPVDAPAPPTPAVSSAPEEDPAKAPLKDDELAFIKKLPDEADQKQAEAQKVCPMTGEHLGSMGVPIKVTAEGHVVFLCCAGCKADFEADPKAALAKLKK